MSENNAEAKGSIAEDGHLKEYFCSKTLFNLSKNIMIETEVRTLENGLDFHRIKRL